MFASDANLLVLPEATAMLLQALEKEDQNTRCCLLPGIVKSGVSFV
jgi:hypothetical protein